MNFFPWEGREANKYLYSFLGGQKREECTIVKTGRNFDPENFLKSFQNRESQDETSEKRKARVQKKTTANRRLFGGKSQVLSVETIGTSKRPYQ